MSTPAFSHQFSQRWLTTPADVKTVILQELDDIVTVLQPETDLHTFSFTTPNLHEKIDAITQAENERLAKIRAEQAEKERLEAERLEKERLEQERIEQLRQETIRREEIRREQQRLEEIRLEKEQLEQKRFARERAEREAAQKKSATTSKPGNSEPQSAVTMTYAPTMTDIVVTQTTTDSTDNSLKQRIIAELQQHIDDYIHATLASTAQQMREQLAPWLETEVEKRLADPHYTTVADK